MAGNEQQKLPLRHWLLFAGIALTLLGCLISALAIALPPWQVVELVEFSAVHEHGVLYDCVRLRKPSAFSPSLPSVEINFLSVSERGKEAITATARGQRGSDKRVCSYKFDEAPSTWTMRMAVEEGDPAAREKLLHRFLPQHKAVLFFFIFSAIFSAISVVVGACSSCFAPNGVLHVVSVGLAAGCSLLGSVIFWQAAHRGDNRYIHGGGGAGHSHEVSVGKVYRQKLGYAFGVHLVGSLVLCAATVCSLAAAYLLLEMRCRRKREGGWRKKQGKWVVVNRSEGRNGLRGKLPKPTPPKKKVHNSTSIFVGDGGKAGNSSSGPRMPSGSPVSLRSYASSSYVSRQQRCVSEELQQQHHQSMQLQPFLNRSVGCDCLDASRLLLHHHHQLAARPLSSTATPPAFNLFTAPMEVDGNESGKDGGDCGMTRDDEGSTTASTAAAATIKIIQV